MALEGSLQDFGLADILQLIYFQRKTGVLTLSGRLDRVRLLFIEGFIIGAESKRRIDDNRLGKILLKKGFISEGDLLATLEEQRKTGAKLGNVIVEKGFADKEIVQDIIRSQITETVIQLFSWKQGAYEFSAQGIPQEKGLSFSLDTQHLLMEGLRIVDEWTLIKDRITLDAIFRKTGEERGGRTEEEQEILAFVDGENDVSTIIDLSGMDNFEVSKMLVSLMDKGVIESYVAAPVVAPMAREERRERRRAIRFLPHGAVILSLLLAAGTLLLPERGWLKTFSAAREMESLRYRIERHRMEHHAYPSTIEEISRRPDPWGRPYVYRVEADSFFVASAGADGKEGTDDDVY